MRLFSRRPVCRKFFTYETSTLDISGLSAGLTKSELAQFNFSLGQFKLSPEFVKVSDMLMLKDLEQYDLCQTISNISDKAERDKLFIELVKIKMEMMRMVTHPEMYEPPKQINPNPPNRDSRQYSIKVQGNNNIIVQGVDGSTIQVFTSFAEIEDFLRRIERKMAEMDEKQSEIFKLMDEFIRKRKGEKSPAILQIVQLLDNNQIPEALEQADQLSFTGSNKFLYNRKKEAYFAGLKGQDLVDWIREMKVFLSQY